MKASPELPRKSYQYGRWQIKKIKLPVDDSDGIGTAAVLVYLPRAVRPQELLVHDIFGGWFVHFIEAPSDELAGVEGE